MKDKKITCQSIWQEYQTDLMYKNSLDLFEKTKQHQNLISGAVFAFENIYSSTKIPFSFYREGDGRLTQIGISNHAHRRYSYRFHRFLRKLEPLCDNQSSTMNGSHPQLLS